MDAILDLKHFHFIRYCGAEAGRPPGAADPSIHSQRVPGRRLHLPGCLETGLKCVTWHWTPSPQGDAVLVALSCDFGCFKTNIGSSRFCVRSSINHWVLCWTWGEHKELMSYCLLYIHLTATAAHFISTSLSLRGFIPPVFCIISITLLHLTRAFHSQFFELHWYDFSSECRDMISADPCMSHRLKKKNPLQ